MGPNGAPGLPGGTTTVVSIGHDDNVAGVMGCAFFFEAFFCGIWSQLDSHEGQWRVLLSPVTSSAQTG